MQNNTIEHTEKETDQINNVLNEIFKYINDTQFQIRSCIRFLNYVKSENNNEVNFNKKPTQKLIPKTKPAPKTSLFHSIWKKAEESNKVEDTFGDQIHLLTSTKVVAAQLENIVKGCQFINALCKPPSLAYQSNYKWLLDNHSVLAGYIIQDDLAEFMAVCSRYTNSYEQIADLSNKLILLLPGELRKNNKNVATLNLLPTFGFEYLNRIQSLFKSLLHQFEKRQETGSHEGEHSVLANLSFIVAEFNKNMNIFNRVCGTYEPNLTLCFRDTEAAIPASEIFPDVPKQTVKEELEEEKIGFKTTPSSFKANNSSLQPKDRIATTTAVKTYRLELPSKSVNMLRAEFENKLKIQGQKNQNDEDDSQPTFRSN